MSDIRWHESLNEARERAAAEGRPLLTYFFAPG